MHGVVSGFLSLYAGSLLTGGVSIGLFFQLCMFFSILLAPKIPCKSFLPGFSGSISCSWGPGISTARASILKLRVFPKV